MTKVCLECGGGAARLRKGRCDACYMRLYRGGEIPAGAACGVCGERRRIVLVRADLGGITEVLCGNCELILARARPRLEGLSALRIRAAHERRIADDRRQKYPVVYSDERRVSVRRASERFPVRPQLDPSID